MGGGWHWASGCRETPESPGLVPMVDGNWIMNAGTGTRIRIAGRAAGRVLIRSRPWTKRVRPSQLLNFKLCMHNCVAWNTTLVNLHHLLCPPLPCKYDRITTLHLQDIGGLSLILAAIAISIITGLSCTPSSLPLAHQNYKHWVLPAVEWTLSKKHADNFTKMRSLRGT